MCYILFCHIITVIHLIFETALLGKINISFVLQLRNLKLREN